VVESASRSCASPRRTRCGRSTRETGERCCDGSRRRPKRPAVRSRRSVCSVCSVCFAFGAYPARCLRCVRLYGLSNGDVVVASRCCARCVRSNARSLLNRLRIVERSRASRSRCDRSRARALPSELGEQTGNVCDEATSSNQSLLVERDRVASERGSRGSSAAGSRRKPLSACASSGASSVASKERSNRARGEAGFRGKKSAKMASRRVRVAY
jgi:hypothetical protein